MITSFIFRIMCGIDSVRAKINATEAEIAEAKRIGDREYVLKLTDLLLKLQDEKNLLLSQKQEIGKISPLPSSL